MYPNQRFGLQGKTWRGLFVYQILKGIQETTDLNNSFASGLSAQALESDNLGSSTLNCFVTLSRLLTSLIFSFFVHKIKVVITMI